MIIFPDKGVKKLDKDVPANIFKVHRENSSYVDRKVMDKWISNVLTPYSKSLPQNKRGILLLDNFEGHISSELKESINNLR